MAKNERWLERFLLILILGTLMFTSSGCPAVMDEDHRGDKVADPIDPNWYPTKN